MYMTSRRMYNKNTNYVLCIGVLIAPSLSERLLCWRCMKGHNHRCHTHTHARLMIMRLFWEYYNSANNTVDDDNFTVSITSTELDELVCVLWRFWWSSNRKRNLCGKCELWGLYFFFLKVIDCQMREREADSERFLDVSMDLAVRSFSEVVLMILNGDWSPR